MKNQFVLLICIALLSAGCSAVDKRPDLPVIKSVSPASASAGETIALSGSFLKTAGKINFGGSVSATPSSTSESQVWVVVPKMPAGPTDIDVESPDGKSGKIGFEVLKSVAKITSIVPNQAKRGETVTIAGENLGQITTVRFSNDSSSAAKFTLEGTSLKVIVPEDAIPGRVYVSNPEGKGFSDEEFIVILKPEIIGLSDNQGVENKEIEIRGRYFQNASIYFGTTKVDPIYNNGSVMKVLCPGFETIQDLEIVIKTIGGDIGHAFTGAPAAAIAKAVPNGLIPGSALTLKGTNFFDIQAVILPDRSKINRKDFIATGQNEVTVKLPVSVTEGNFQIASQYGAGSTLALNLVNGGGGLNGDNIANGPTGIGSIGGLSRPCNPYTIKDYHIAYFPKNSLTSPESVGGVAFAGTYSILVYDRCFCSDECSSCQESNDGGITWVPKHCFDESETDYYYGNFKTIGDREYRKLNGGLGNFPCASNAIGWANGGYPSCIAAYDKPVGNAFFTYHDIFLELEKKGTTIDKDVYTGFAIVEFRRQKPYPETGYEITETYYGNKISTGEYILESTSGNQNRLKIKLENF